MQIGDKQLQRKLGVYATVVLVCQSDMDQLQKLQANRQAVDQASINPAISMVLHAPFHVLPYAQPDGMLSYHFLLVLQDMAQHAATMSRHLARHDRDLQSRLIHPTPENSSSQVRKVRQRLICLEVHFFYA